MPTLTALRVRDDVLQELADDADAMLQDATAHEVIAWAADTFGERLVVTSSMADGLLAHLAGEVIPGIEVIFLDTGYHFAETIGTRDAVVHSNDVRLLNVQPLRTVAEQDAVYGPRLFERDPDACCRLRKVEPLDAALRPYLAWISGLRRDQSRERADTPVVGYDDKRGKVAVHPLATWTAAQVEAYKQAHDILVNPLQREGYVSIGCAPCTRAVRPGEDPRAARWAGRDKTECGIHL